MPPVKAFEYDVELEVLVLDHDTWTTAYEREFAYTAADAITQAELRYKHMDCYEKAYVKRVQPRYK